MVRSRFKTFDFWVLSVASTFFVLMALFSLINYYFGTNIMNVQSRGEKNAVIHSLGFLGAALIFIIPLFKYANVITIDALGKTITFRNLFTGNKKSYLFEEFIGYFRMQRKDLRYKHLRYNIIFLVKSNGKTIRLSSFYYSNLFDLANGFKDIPFWSTEKYSFLKDMQFTFGRVSFN